MSNEVPKFEFHRQQLASSLAAVANSMRSCAQFADTFSTVVADLQYSPEEAALAQGKGKRKAALMPEDGEAPKKRKRTIKPKDPNAPKKPASAYLLFQNEVRNELKNQNPTLTNSEILSLISAQWKKMTPEQKQTYFRIVEKAKVQYSKAKQDYESNLAESQATDAATEVESMLQKEGAKPRGPKSATATGIAPEISTTIGSAKPASLPSPSKASVVVSPSTDFSEDEESEEEPQQQESDSSVNDEESEEPEPSPKKRRTGSAQPKSQKAKKSSKK